MKLVHLMRAMEYTPRDMRAANLRLALWSSGVNRIGQQVFMSSTVFNFFESDYTPAGPLAAASLVAPEAQLGTAPFIVGFLNGAFSLINYGLTSCHGGVGSPNYGRRCGRTDRARATADGALAFSPTSTLAGGLIDELDLLLTGGRLSEHTRIVVRAAYDAKLAATSDTADAMRVAQALIVASAEFHTTNANVASSIPRVPRVEQPSQGRLYKAVIVLFLGGGVDSFNMLVPLSDCGTATTRAEYDVLRQHHALSTSTLLPISVPAGTQPCATFGLHPSLPALKAMYDGGDAAFIANIGTLVEPLNRADVQCHAPPCRQTPPALYAHNTQSTRAFSVHAQSASAHGVVGRIIDALTSGTSPYKTAAYSLADTAKILEGEVPVDMIGAEGVERVEALTEIAAPLAEMGALESTSLFAETYMRLLNSSIATTEDMGALLDNVTTSEPFAPAVDEGDSLSPQLRQIAKIIKLRHARQTERDFFFAKLGGFDTHNDEDGSERTCQPFVCSG